MPSYKAPVEDFLFLLNDVFHIDVGSGGPADSEFDVSMTQPSQGAQHEHG
jgi:hypothetical protein